MSLGAVRDYRRTPRHLALAERRRREIRDVRHPAAPEVRIDRILVGPTGIHVVTPVPAPAGPSAAPLVDAALVTVGRTAADLVAAALPARYRDRVHPVLCRADDVAMAETVDGLLLTSRATFEHILAASRAVLSTSEVNEIALRLDARLEPFPVTSTTQRRRWRRGRNVAAAAVASAVTLLGADQVWGFLPVP